MRRSSFRVFIPIQLHYALVHNSQTPPNMTLRYASTRQHSPQAPLPRRPMSAGPILPHQQHHLQTHPRHPSHQAIIHHQPHQQHHQQPHPLPAIGSASALHSTAAAETVAPGSATRATGKRRPMGGSHNDIPRYVVYGSGNGGHVVQHGFKVIFSFVGCVCVCVRVPECVRVGLYVSFRR